MLVSKRVATLKPGEPVEVKKPMLVSVLLPVCNQKPVWLGRAIDSILSQTYQDLELLVLDGSTDSQMLRHIEQLVSSDPRIRYFHEPHLGFTATLNAGLLRARGQFICRHDSDDWSEPSRIELQVSFLRSHPAIGVVGSAVIAHREDGQPLWQVRLPGSPDQINRALPRGNPFYHGATCFRASVAKAIGGYREDLATAEDYDFFWRLCDASAGTNLTEALYHYQYGAGSLSPRSAMQHSVARRAVQLLASSRRNGHEEDVSAALRQAERQCQQTAEKIDALLKQADWMLLAGHYRAAVRTYSNLVNAYPTHSKTWLKLARCVAFLSVPPARAFLFSVAGVAVAVRS